MERDPKVKGIIDNWNSNAPNLSKKTLDKIGELWITQILDCDENTLNAFIADEVNDEIGLKQVGDINFIANIKGFWNGVKNAAPEIITSDDLEYLIENDYRAKFAWSLILALDGFLPLEDCIPTKLVGNAINYRIIT